MPHQAHTSLTILASSRLSKTRASPAGPRARHLRIAHSECHSLRQRQPCCCARPPENPALDTLVNATSPASPEPQNSGGQSASDQLLDSLGEQFGKGNAYPHELVDTLNKLLDARVIPSTRTGYAVVIVTDTHSGKE